MSVLAHEVSQTSLRIPDAAVSTPPLCESDLKETDRFLLGATDQAKHEFALRQLRARRRTTQLINFYRQCHCHMARIHLLAASAVMLGRLCGFSTDFDEMGERFMPITIDGLPRTSEWLAYMQACLDRRPWQLRDELWLVAHMKDMKQVHAEGLDLLFYQKAAEHSRDPMWRMVKRHMETTLGSRMLDDAAISGEIAVETAIAHSFVVALKNLFSAGFDLLCYFVRQTAWALLFPIREPKRGILGYRRAALILIKNSILAWTACRIYKRGIRARERGSEHSDAYWPLLEQALGPRVAQVHPLIVDFYSNPARFRAKVSLRFSTVPARITSYLATLLLGQGLYESDITEIETRFRTFRRDDNSLHFVRELYCGEVMRTFDSDFVVKEHDGDAKLFEVFSDLGCFVSMDVEPLPDGGLKLRGRDIYYRGMRLPSTGLNVEFQSHVSDGTLTIEGKLLMQPRTRWGRFIARNLLRRPEELGGIAYLVRPLAEAAAGA